MYKENPKTKGSGIVCAIPQTGTCPNNCEDCFFQSGRSYLEPLVDNLPNMPEVSEFEIVRVNDGNDSNVDYTTVSIATKNYPHKFYNTAIPTIPNKTTPFVLTVNPGANTDKAIYYLTTAKNLMFVRFRTNTWNTTLADECVRYYSEREIPIVLTFMAYYGASIPEEHRDNYVFRKRTLNSYNAITTKAWRKIMQKYEDNKWVHSCGKIEGELGDTHCRFCGNCLREYFATIRRITM